jgi:N-acetylmuramidase
MITEQMFVEASKAFTLEAALIKAVAEVESRGEGVLPDGRPKILFEPHIFWKQLQAHKLNPKSFQKGNTDILYPSWKSSAYGPVSGQHDRLERASRIHREAALASCSWGKFQVMGFNWKACGSSSLQDFINSMYKGEEEQLVLFLRYLEKTGLIKALRLKDWRSFAAGYNGPLYAKNNYHNKLKAAYLKYL